MLEGSDAGTEDFGCSLWIKYISSVIIGKEVHQTLCLKIEEAVQFQPTCVRGANVIVKGSFIDLDDQCLMRQYRKMRRVMSDSILVGVLDVPEVYEPGKFSNEFEKTENAKQTPLLVEDWAGRQSSDMQVLQVSSPPLTREMKERTVHDNGW